PKQQAMMLAGTSGIDAGNPVAPEIVALHDHSLWPFNDVISHQELHLISDLGMVNEHLPTGAWKQPPHRAVALPIAPSGETGQAGVLIVGLNPFRRFDE